MKTHEPLTPVELFALEDFFFHLPNAEVDHKQSLDYLSELIISCSARTGMTQHLSSSEHEAMHCDWSRTEAV